MMKDEYVGTLMPHAEFGHEQFFSVQANNAWFWQRIDVITSTLYRNGNNANNTNGP